MKSLNFLKLLCIMLLICCGISFFVPANIQKSTYADVSTQEIRLEGGSIESANLWLSVISQYKNWSTTYDGSTLPSSYCMRDEYIIFTENQTQHGLCWAFTGTNVLSTTLMKATGEYYDFSEGYVATALNSLSNDTELKASLGLSSINYYVGGGGNFYYFDLLSQYSGVLLESDFTYEEYHNVVSESSTDYYNFLYEDANKTLMDNFIRGSYSTYVDSENKEVIKNSIKQHILNHGALYAGMDWGTTGTTTYNGQTIYYKTPCTSASGGHAVTLIGWDDDIVIGEYTGAWIFLNSWGNDSGNNGIYYAVYDDTDIYTFMGYKYVGNTTDLYLTTQIADSNADYTITNAGAYIGDFETYENQSKTENVFYKDDIELTYKYEISSGSSIESVDVYHYDEPCDVDVSINQSNKTITISGENLEIGNYKVVITYKNSSSTEQYLNNFYVLDGLEIEYARYNFSSSGYGSIVNNGIYQIFDGKNVKDNELIFATSESSSAIMIRIYTDGYSKVTGITSESSGVSVRSDMTNKTKGYYGFQINIASLSGNQAVLTMSSSNGKTKDVNVKILKATSTTQKMINILYDLNGGVNSDDNDKRVLVSSQNAATIYAPTKDGYNFTGWYTDVNLTNALTKSGSEYVLSYSKVNILESCTVDDSVQTFFDNYYQTSQYVFLYAGWERHSASVTFHYNNGEGDTTQYLEMGSTIDKPEDPTREGYTFSGWYTSNEFTTKFDFSTLINGNIHLYAYWIINSYTVIFYYNNGTASSSMSINYGGTVTAPIITKTGYTLDGWYTESTFENKWNFSSTIKGDLGLHAKWQLNAPQNVTISSESTTYQTALSYTINLNYTHELSSGVTIKVKWYRNNTLIQTTNSVSITEKLYNAGVYEYKAILTLTHDGQSSSVQSNSLQIVINQRPINISNITYHGQGYFTWDDAETGHGYNVLLFMSGGLNAVYEVGGGTVIDTNANVANGLTAAGEYYIVIEKYFEGDLIGSITSDTFNIYSISYETYQVEDIYTYKTEYVDEGFILNGKAAPIRENYYFMGWYDSAKFENVVQFPLTITASTTIYANYKISGITISEISDIERVYNKDVSNEIVVEASHPINGTYSYSWIKLSGGVGEVQAGNTFVVKNVADSGEYAVEVTLTDGDGFKGTAVYSSFWIKITRAETEISYSNMQRYYTYNGNEQIIQGGAKITRDDDVVEVSYYNNKFTDVPEGGILNVSLIAPATENYALGQATVEIYINKLQGTIFAESYQSFTYNGREIVPVCSINNKEQVVVCSTQLKDVGKYSNVEVKASESTNYLEAITYVTVEILQATIEIRVKDTTSFWLLGKNELKYEINGEYYGEDLNVKLICDVDTTKIGEYTITAQIDNPNYKVYVIEGIYTVSAMPYYIAGGLIVLIVILVLALRSRRKFSIEFIENGGTLIAPIETKKKSEINLAEPTRSGYKFMGWYLDENFTIPYKEYIKKGKPVTLFARWDKVVVVNPKQERMIRADEIVRSLNIGVSKQEEKIETKIIVEDIKPKEVVKEKTQEDIMNDLIQKATQNSNGNFSSDDINKLINHLTNK